MFKPSFTTETKAENPLQPCVPDQRQVQLLRKLREAELSWQRTRRAIHFCAIGVFACFAIFFLGLLAHFALVPQAKSPPLAVGFVMLPLVLFALALIVVVLLNSRTRTRYFGLASEPIWHIPMLRMGEGEGFTHQILRSRESGYVELVGWLGPKRLRLLKWLALFAILLLIAVPMYAYATVRSSNASVPNFHGMWITITFLSALSAFAFAPSVSRVRFYRTPDGNYNNVEIEEVPLLGKERLRTIPIDESWFEITTTSVFVVQQGQARQRLLSVPYGPLGAWHATRLLASVNEVLGLEEDSSLYIEIDRIQLPVTWWPLVNSLESTE